jgi:C4-type Zn-finger protein
MTDLSKYRAHYLTELRAKRLIDSGRCPVCEMLLASTYHTNCPYLKDIHT